MTSKKLTSYPKEKINILLLENISESAIDQFKQAGYARVRKLSGAQSEEELIKQIADVHLLGIRSKTQISRRVLEAADKLQAIGCFCIGVNQVDLHAAMQSGVAVFNAPYSNTRSVAELVIGASVMLVRKIMDKNKAAHSGLWQKESGGSHELRGKTLGIIGYGNIGSQVSVLAEAMGMRVRYYDVATRLPLGNAQPCKSLKELLQESDVVTLHVPATDSTFQMIGKAQIRLMKPGAMLINYARGEVVDIPALRAGIQSGQLGGAAVDVFPVEPEKNGDPFVSELQGLPNVLLTPHIGGSTEEAQENIGFDVSHKLLEYLEKGTSTGSHSIPALALPPQEDTHRILHIHFNKPGVMSQINTSLSKKNINILAQYLTTNNAIGYVVLDVDKHMSRAALELLKQVKQTIKVRMLY